MVTILLRNTRRVSFFLFCWVLIGGAPHLGAQNNGESIQLGFNYGQGSQSNFPFSSTDYTYDNRYYKLQIRWLQKQSRRWRFEWNIEPSFFVSQHQLLNENFVQPNRGHDYLEQRERFTKLKTIHEYMINVGFLSRYRIFKQADVYFMGSIGPLISDEDTERLKKGFAFSDILALGLSYRINPFVFEVRWSIRHVSNANLFFPNDGHNSASLGVGFVYFVTTKSTKFE